eukprot:gene49716-66595_t
MAGKEPLIASNVSAAVHPRPLLLRQPTSANDISADDESSSALLTPLRTKPLPTPSPLTGSAIIVSDGGGDENETDLNPSHSLRLRPKLNPRLGNAWRGDPEEEVTPIRLPEPSLGIESMDHTRPFSEVSRVLDFGGGKEDDEPLVPLPPPLPKKQLSFLVV